MDKKPIVINLFAGPSCGKSTMAGGIFGILKLHNVKCEYIQEFAKDLVYENRIDILKYNQLYLFAKQYTRMIRSQFRGVKPEILITDSPLLLGLVYNQNISLEEKACIKKIHRQFTNWNYFIIRDEKKPFIKMGRNQNNKKECQELDLKILDMLKENTFSFEEINFGHTAINVISYEILNHLGINPNFCMASWKVSDWGENNEK